MGLPEDTIATQVSSGKRGIVPHLAFGFPFSILVLLALLALAPAASTQSAVEWRHLSSKTGDLPAPGPGRQQTASLILDVDRDGVNDFILAERTASPSVTWFRRVADRWEKYIVEDDVLSIEAGGDFADIDGDGDLDISFAGDSGSNQVWWWENPYPSFAASQPWTRRLVKNSGGVQHHDQVFGDFDGDGQAELAFWNNSAKKLFLAEIPADARITQPWPLSEIFAAPAGAEGLTRADIDGDGKIDLVGGGYWFKHVEGTRFEARQISAFAFSRTAAGQLVKGGWAEVVIGPGDNVGRLNWYEWNGSGWVGHDLLGFDVDHGHSLAIEDIDGDGHLDVFCAEMRLNGGNDDAKMWVFYGDGRGGFTKTEVATGFGNHESKVGDLDGDGDMDILGKPYNWDTPRVDVWLNQSGRQLLPLDRWARHALDANRPWRAVFVYAADLNGDHLQDAVAGGWWYPNPGDAGGAWSRRTIGTPLNNVAAVADFDDDGDLDLLGTRGQGSAADSSFLWARNDGHGSFTLHEKVPTGQGDFLQGVAVARFRNAGPLEVALSWHAGGGGVQMLTVPPNPADVPWSWRLISTVSQDEALSAGDVDRDGDLDLLLGTQWLRNDGASWSPFALGSISGSPDRNLLADINRDGRLDAVVGFEAISAPGKLAWYEQPLQATSVWTEHRIADPVGPMSLDAGDLDGDGDLDLVVGEHNLSNPAAARLLIFENGDGQGLKWSERLIYTGDEHHDGAQLTDIEGDGDLDVLSIGWGHASVLLYENLAIDINAPTPSFADVPPEHWAYRPVEALFKGGFISGCSAEPRKYCPASTMTRAESAVFVERGIHGGGYLPGQPGEQVFADVPLSEWYAKWADGLWRDGYTAGCGTGPLRYCPLAQHTRAEATVFFERMLHGAEYIPPQPTSSAYDDVPMSAWYAKWVDGAERDGLLQACEAPPDRGDRLFRPLAGLTRAEAACMMAKAKGIP